MIPNFEPGDDVKVILVFGDGFIAKNTTLFLLYGELKEEREGLTLEDQKALLSIDENVKCFKSKRKRTDDVDDEEEAYLRRAKRAKTRE
ncbi:hypothetical protein L6164_000229 [Bauhinia variegata]|uniref:Uncharacterized protein n=1 Tax=Bauhinia variegata TaxID=167791 RepID=A0ACB9Q5A5_BAUVA|nr:hypothetical protein L6164_000229 [Bauhinia variegata]